MYEKISVELVNTMGTDLTVVNAARVSFNKESEWEGEQHWSGTITGKKLSDKDAKLISYLATHNHWSPFAHCTLQFRIKAPIFVARQLQKHQVGFAWNEVSRRYVDYKPTFWSPDNQWRSRAENKKQGSADALVRDNTTAQRHYDEAMHYVQLSYELLLSCGVCPEQARSILPQSMMTEWYWTGSLYGFARVCKLRLDPHAQAECREVAKVINDFCSNEFPISWRALNGTVA